MQQSLQSIEGILVGVLFALGSVFILKPMAYKVGLIDNPGGRKNHKRSTPLIGGIMVYFGFTIGVLILPIPSIFYQPVLVGSFVLLCVGALDDRYDIKPSIRMLFQIAAILYLVFQGHHGLYYVGHIFYFPHGHLTAWLAVGLTVVLTLGFINAINMLDGQDGCVGSIAFTELFLLTCVSLYLGERELALILVCFLAILMVFLLFNLPMPWRTQASIFLGDSGSNFLAFFIAWAVIYLSQIPSDTIKPITLIWILALPFFDMTSACVKRTVEGRSWAHAGHDHIHHLLQSKHLSVLGSTAVIVSLSLGFGLIGLLFAALNVSEGLQSFIYLGVFIGYVLLTWRLKANQVSQDVLHSENILNAP